MTDSDNDTQKPDVEQKNRKPRAVRTEPLAIDTAWFTRRLAEVGKSSNALGRHIGVAPSQVSRMLNGLRAMKFDEVPKIARFLNVPVEEVLKRAGLPVADGVVKPMTADSVISADYKVTTAPEPWELPQVLAERAAAMVPLDKRDTIATALVRAPKGALHIIHDNVVVHEAEWSQPRVMGTMSLVKLREGVVLANEITAASKTGEVTMVMADGSIRQEKAESIKPVIVVLQ